MTRLPHLDSLDQRSDQHLSDEIESSPSPNAGAEETYVMPASLEQSRYWTLAQIDPGSTASNMAISCEITGSIDPLLIEQAIAALTLRHEALRTLFRIVDGHLSQVVLTRPLYEFTQQDIARTDKSATPESALAAALSAHSHAYIDLEHGPVVRARLLRLATERHVLAITMSHIVCDGWSNGVLLRDFIRIYHALRSGAGSLEDIAAGRASGLPELPFQFADFTVWQNEYLNSDRGRAALQFWTSHIPLDLAALDMPADFPRKPGRSFPGTIASTLLPASLNDVLVAWCRKTGSTKHIALLACFEAVCARFSGQHRFLLGSTIANRTQPGMEDIVGRFANPQIIVADVEGDPTFHELEARVRDWETSAYTHQDLPFSRIIEEFQMSQEGAGSQFLQVWFVYQKAFMQPQEVPGLSLQPLRSVSGGVDFDLLVSVVERAEGPRLQIEYNTELFSSERIEGLLAAFQQMLVEVLADPNRPISQITSSVAAPPRPVPSADAPLDLLAIIAHHASARPDAIAIRAAARQLSWRELQERSHALAAYLAQPYGADLELLPQVESAPSIETNSATVKNDDVSREVSDIWKDVLNLKIVDPHLPFFETGGNSLLLVRLFARLNKSFGTRLPITTIFDASTIARLSERIRSHADIRALVPVQTHGNRPPVFMIHSYLLYQALSQSLGDAQPFYGLRELESDSDLDMQQRVANYVREIRTVQAHGPYSLMGWCAAGPLTVEVARHLVEAGETVDSVILFDSWLPGYFSRVENAGQTSVRRSRWRTVLSKLQRHREKVQPLSTSQRVQYIRSAVMRYALARRNRFFIRHWSTFNTLATRFRLELPQFMYNTTLTTFAAMSAYRPHPVPIHLSLIRARDTRDVAGASEACGWEQVATQGVEVRWAPGDHETMFLGDNLKATTALIRHCLDGEIPEAPSQDPTVQATS